MASLWEKDGIIPYRYHLNLPGIMAEVYRYPYQRDEDSRAAGWVWNIWEGADHRGYRTKEEAMRACEWYIRRKLNDEKKVAEESLALLRRGSKPAEGPDQTICPECEEPLRGCYRCGSTFTAKGRIHCDRRNGRHFCECCVGVIIRDSDGDRIIGEGPDDKAIARKRTKRGGD